MPMDMVSGAPVRVLHIVRQYAPGDGGIEAYVRTLCAHQRRQGLDPSVLTLNRIWQKSDTILQQCEVIDDVVVRRIPFRGRRHLFVPIFNPASLRNFDIIHMHAIDQFCDVVCASWFLYRRPLVLTTHGGFFHTSKLATIKRIYFKTISRLTLRQADEVIACSSNDQNMMQRIGINATLMPNAIVSLDECAAGSDLLYLGRLAENKQVAQLIDFVAALRRLGSPRRLHIVGDDFDGLKPALQQRIAHLSLEDDVVLHGYLSFEDLKAILEKCGFFVSASRYEGFGMSMLEAMTAGLIPFVHANESFSELLGSTNPKSLTDFADSDSAASQFVELSAAVSQSERDRLRAFALQFSWPELANNVLAAYRKVSIDRTPTLTTRLAMAEELPQCESP